MVIRFPIQLLGSAGNAGCYLLLIRLKHDQEIQFGRFKRGRAFFLPNGFYLYIGSARGTKVASSLGYRLIRHTIRTGGKSPHLIRNKLHVLLQDAGIPYKVPTKKHLHWHIDHMLDLDEAEIQAVIAIRSYTPDEKTIAEKLSAMPGISIPVRGLGAGDNPGGTHLLKVANPDIIWRQLSVWITKQTNSDDGKPKI